MNRQDPQNCWEFWDCPPDVKEKCLAYDLRLGKECWTVAGINTRKEARCTRVKLGFKDCWECAWFKKMKPDMDEGGA
jgi:hypothetical protein